MRKPRDDAQSTSGFVFRLNFDGPNRQENVFFRPDLVDIFTAGTISELGPFGIKRTEI